ncbi:hypothetical protein SUDANB120_05564 [Streptomyces sp. enrichment culture]|uniref:hypothetical protein n=1 Tax=Streptomyces TaxID=1883 RepID=UPI00167A8ADC|nr:MULTISPECIES: hypothetical protein [Streptomyces]MBD3575836.1 hypothetical protein [Streptomyces sp. KD18]
MPFMPFPRGPVTVRPARSLVRACAPAPLLLLAAAGPALAAAGQPDFQYVGRDDRVHGLTAPEGCVEARGGGARGVTNNTSGTAYLYSRPGCAGTPVEVLRPGAGGRITPYFDSVRFDVTASAQRP